MPLNLIGDGYHRRDVHFRHYLGPDGQPTVICVQDFDYHDYIADRFLSTVIFNTENEALATPIDPSDLIDAADEVGELGLIARNLRALLHHPYASR